MKIDLTGQRALVTGGTRGIGAATAKILAAAGARVVVTGTGKTDVKSEDFWAVDFGNKDELDLFVRKIKDEKFDVLINNAGTNKIDKVENIDESDWDFIQQVNLKAPFLLIKGLAPGMAKRGYGRIVNISSVFGHVSRAERSSYSTSKFGLLGLTKAAALDFAKSNVLVNAVAPGFVDTELTRSVLSGNQIEELVKTVPMGRLGTTEEIAKVILFLASPENTFLTGQSVVVDGGFTSV